MNRHTNNKMHECVLYRNTVDSFGNYVSTYRHKLHRHLLGFKDSDPSLCKNCNNWSPQKGERHV